MAAGARCSWCRSRSTASRRRTAMASTIGFLMRQPGRGRRLACGRGRGWRHVDRGSARHPRATLSASSTSPICAIPTATSCAGSTGAAGVTLETVSEVKSHGGVQGVYRHASAATGTDMTFSVFVPAAARERRAAAGALVSERTHLHPRQCHREGRVSRRLRRGRHHLRRARHQPARRGRARRSARGHGISGWARAFTSTRPSSPGRPITACGAMSPRNCRRWLPTISRSIRSGRGSPAIRWAATAR